MIRISVVLPTLRRLPRFKELADSLARSLDDLHDAGMVGELQLVVVDGRLWYDDKDRRKKQLRDAVRDRFWVTHVEPKPSVWQGPFRLTTRDLWDKASASNTGLCYAEGACVLFVDDCSLVSETCLRAHLTMADRGIAACGPYAYALPGARVEDGRLVDATLESPGDHRPGMQAVAGPCPPGWMYGGNASCPLDAALKVNGFEELMSGQGGLEDCEFGLRIARVVPLWFLPGAIVYQLTETHEPVAQYLGHVTGDPCGCGHNLGDHEGCNACRLCSCGAYKTARDLRCKGYPYKDGNGVVHHMSDNHRLIYRLLGMRVTEEHGFWEPRPDPTLEPDTRRVTTLGNAFDLRELREALGAGRYFPVPGEPKTDWRDGQALAEM